MKKLVFTIFLLSFCGFVHAEDAPANVSLLTVQCKADESICQTQEIIRYNFTNGEFISKETVASASTDDARFDFGDNSIYQKRFIIGRSGDIFDLQTKQFLGDGRGWLVDVIGNDVIFELNQIDMEGFFAFNLETKEYRKLPSPNVFESEGETYPNNPGKLSPNKKRFAYWKNSGFKAELQFLDVRNWKGVKNKLIKGSFYASCSFRCSGGIEAPFVWIDDETILTQKSNGEILSLNINGKLEKIVNIPIDELPDALPRFSKDEYGNFTYHIGGTSYAIDIKNKSFINNREILGNNFFVVHGEPFRTEYFYKNSSIGSLWSSEPVTYKGFIAVSFSTDGKQGIVEGTNLFNDIDDGINIWNDIKKEWITFEIDGLYQIIGFLEE